LKFPGVTPSLGTLEGGNDLIAYAFLQKNLPFEVLFDVLPEPVLFHAAGGDLRVKGFGFKTLDGATGSMPLLKQQVAVLHYASDDEFVIRLKPKKDGIILAKVPPAATLADTLQAVQQRIQASAQRREQLKLQDKDSLGVPRLAFNVLRRYDELLKKMLRNPG